MENKKPQFRFRTNIPSKIKFLYDNPKTGTGQYGEWYLWGIEAEGIEQGLFASKGLQDKLSQLGKLYGRTLEITKVETDDNRTFWEIKENGQDVTPSRGDTSKPTEQPNASPSSNLELTEAFQKHYRVLSAEVAQLKKDMTTLKRLHPEFDNSQVLDEVAEEKVARMIDETPADFTEEDETNWGNGTV